MHLLAAAPSEVMMRPELRRQHDPRHANVIGVPISTSTSGRQGAELGADRRTMPS